MSSDRLKFSFWNYYYKIKILLAGVFKHNTEKQTFLQNVPAFVCIYSGCATFVCSFVCFFCCNNCVLSNALCWTTCRQHYTIDWKTYLLPQRSPTSCRNKWIGLQLIKATLELKDSPKFRTFYYSHSSFTNGRTAWIKTLTSGSQHIYVTFFNWQTIYYPWPFKQSVAFRRPRSPRPASPLHGWNGWTPRSDSDSSLSLRTIDLAWSVEY